MALFRKGKSRDDSSAGKGGKRIPLTPRTVYCRICEVDSPFTQCWRRTERLRQCECCGTEFDNPEVMYRQTPPSCPVCQDFLEQPSFEYGVCDGCGSKFELVEGTLPNLLPNRFQREEMDKVGRVHRRLGL